MNWCKKLGDVASDDKKRNSFWTSIRESNISYFVFFDSDANSDAVLFRMMLVLTLDGVSLIQIRRSKKFLSRQI